MPKGSLFIVSGPSGVGKGTIVKRVTEMRDDIFLSISCTTRAPREGEADGVNYYYITEEEFKRRIADGYFIEWERYVDHYYGTPAHPVWEAGAQGKSTILEIEVGGAFKAKERYPEAVLVFVLPPSTEELERRLMERDSGNAAAMASVKARMARAREEYQYIDRYDYVIVNEDLEEAITALEAIIDAEASRVKNNQSWIEKIKEEQTI